jgi:lambda repressor-like predicted transcriptional regulator
LHEEWRATPALRRRMNEVGMSVRALATEIDYSKSHLYNVLARRSSVRRVLAERIAALLDMDCNLLFELAPSEGEG